jgi:recombinational DNA repair protein (RecF pathway)
MEQEMFETLHMELRKIRNEIDVTKIRKELITLEEGLTRLQELLEAGGEPKDNKCAHCGTPIPRTKKYCSSCLEDFAPA